MGNEATGNQGLDRAASVLDAIAKGRALRVAEVAQGTGLGQSTVSRLLAALEGLDYVQRDQDGLYRLGLAFLSLAGSALNEHPVYRNARQPAQNLAALLGLGVNVGIRRDAELYYLCNFEGRNAPKHFTLMGHQNPLHATALGKCLLASLTAAERRTLLPELPSFTPHTAVDHDDLDATIDAVKRQGYATEREELALGRTCVAAPIVDKDGKIVAAISISGPLTAIDIDVREPEISRLAIEVSDTISGALGYLGPTDVLVGVRE